jgi:uncharacterized membrane protein
MSKKGQKKNQNKMAVKKAAVLGTGEKSRLPLVVAVAGIILIAGVALFYASRGSRTAIVPSPSVASSTSVTFPAGIFEDGKARHFKHVDGNFTIRYFILKSSDGIIRAAFDACDVCWPAGKGYYQQGDVMICRNCGRRFASILVNEVKGGCNPAPLTRTITNGRVIIQINDILNGRKYFDFSGKV